MKRYRLLLALAAIGTIVTMTAVDYADARAGRGFSSGSRGARTFAPPAATKTAPTAAPIQRSTTAQPGSPSAGAATAAGASRGGMFGGGLMGGLAAGFLGAGLFGMLFGGGFLAGMGSFASILGLLLQVVLVVVVARLAFNWWQRRKSPNLAMQSASPSQTGGAPGAGTPGFGGVSGVSGVGGMFGGGATAAPAAAGEPITIEKADYDEFEQLLNDVQAAYSEEDEVRLRTLATSEMVGYFAEQQQEYGSRGLVNRVSDVKLLSGDLSEAWREGTSEYATVAMRFSFTDSVVERDSGRTVEGGEPAEATELWTFRRDRSGHWLLSAIQQAS